MANLTGTTLQRSAPPPRRRYHRLYEQHLHLATPFGSDWFGRRAETFARFFGTPTFIAGQTAIVAAWIAANAIGIVFSWDPYPFILLNLAFSLQAAYAAPLILLAQTRQADRDKALALADAEHRDAVARESAARQVHAAATERELRLLLESNTQLTEETARLAGELERLTREIHARVCELRPDGEPAR